MRHALIALVVGLLVGAAGTWLALRHKHPEAPHHEDPEEKTLQRTIWTDRHEVFVEHPVLVAGEPAHFVTHITDLASHEPRREGPITYSLQRADQAPIEVPVSRPARDGIYTPSLGFPQAGDWKVAIRIDQAVVDLGGFVVHPSKATAEASPTPEVPEGISFLKEQQWMLRTRSEVLGRRRLVQRLRVSGVVSPRPGSRAALTAPIEGRLIAPSGRRLPGVGERVEAGQVLALVQPPFSEFSSKLIEAEAETVRAQVALEQAEAAAARLRKLVADKARTERELSEAEFALRTARANFEAARSLRAAYAKSGAVLTGEGSPAFEMRSPISGVVVRVAAAEGENVHTEHAVFTILDSSRVWVEARVSEADFNRLGGSSGAILEMPYGRDHLRQAGPGPTYVAAEVELATRTVAVIYEVGNEAGDLRIGLAVTLHIETARSEDGIALPESAAVDEEGRFVAFVQVSGETFEKRDLALGIRDAGFVQVLSGLKEGDRVVTKGGYAVRLASVSRSIPAHGHAH